MFLPPMPGHALVMTLDSRSAHTTMCREVGVCRSGRGQLSKKVDKLGRYAYLPRLRSWRRGEQLWRRGIQPVEVIVVWE